MTPRDLQETAAAPRGCLDDNEVVEYARGLVSPAQRAAVERHIDRCADCRVAVSDLARMFDAVSSRVVPQDPTLPTNDATAPGLEPLARLGRYLVLHRLGAGGMGVVHAGYDPELDRKVALKLLASPGALDREGQARLIQEAQALAMVSHPQVVAVHDVGVHQGCVWLAMEYIDGATLSVWLRARPRGWRELLAVFLAAGEGLAAVHAVGLVHRDFKPDNVMIDAAGRVRVMDLGLSRVGFRDPQDSVAMLRVDRTATSLTRTGSLLGTPRYMAPEQWLGEVADARSDEFSFCVALWEALYGEAPFAGEDAGALAASVCAGELRTPPAGARVPRWVRRVVTRGLARDPARRFGSMRALLTELARDPTRQVRRRVALALLAVTAAGAALFVELDRDRRAAICEAEAAGLARVWTPAVRAELRRGAAASGDEAVARNVERAIELGDAYAVAWAEQRGRGCVQATVDRSLDDDLRRRRDACLDDGRAGLEVVVGEAGRAEPRMLQRLGAAIAGLRAPERCADPDVLRRYPPQTVTTPAAAAVRRVVARSGMLVFIGAFDEAAAELRAADDAAAAAGGGSQALVDMAAADLAYHRGDMGAAHARLVAAHDRAGAAGLDEIAAEAATFLVDVDGFYLAQPGAGRDWLRLAEMWLTRMGVGPDDERRVSLLITEGKLRKAEGDLVGARRLLEHALEVARGYHGASHPDLGGLLLELGVVHALAGDAVAAYARSEHALAVIEAARGPQHPQVADALYNLAQLRADAGDHARAVAYLERARAIYAASHGPADPSVAEVWARIGVVERARGDHAAALAAFERARDLAEQAPGAPEVLALALAGVGQAELELHGPGAARPALERALALPSALADDPAARGAAQLALARALAAVDPDEPRIDELLHAARDSFVAAAPAARAGLAAIDPWLARRGADRSSARRE